MKLNISIAIACVVLLPGVAHGDPLPGEFAIRSAGGNFVTAVGGGGRTSDAIHTDLKDSLKIGSWEKFKLHVAPGHHRIYAIQTTTQHFVTAVGGGGRTTEPFFQTDRIHVQAWEQFNIFKQWTWSYIRVSNGDYVKLANGLRTGKSDDAGTAFLFYKCGEPGPDSFYHISWATGGDPPRAPYDWLQAYGGGGRVSGAMGLHLLTTPNLQGTTFRLIRQADGKYALQTQNGINFVTAVAGGGQSVAPTLQTNRTQVLAWEKFRLWIMPDCGYAFQTDSGHWLGLIDGRLTTRSQNITGVNKFRLHPANFGPRPGS